MRAKNISVKQKLIAILISFAIIATAFPFLFSAPVSSAAADGVSAQSYNSQTNLDISNGDFTDASGDKPMQPSNWTGTALEGTLEGSTVDGVVDLTPAEINNAETLKKYKLDELYYDDFKNGNYPTTPFGRQNTGFDGSDANALMINSANSDVAYGYSSSSVSLAANSYYRISAWVKTGSFGGDTGAYIKIDGLKNPLVFRNIDTTDYWDGREQLDFGWVEYSFYIETSTMIDSSITISLQLGDVYDYQDKNGNEHSERHTANGYAFFDHVTAYQCSYNLFASQITGLDNAGNFTVPDKDGRHYYVNDEGNSMYYSESDAEYLCIDKSGNLVGSDGASFDTTEIGSFNNGLAGWETAENSSGSPSIGIFDAISENIGIKNTIPYSPNGKNDNIFVLSSYDANNSPSNYYDNASIGYKTKQMFTVERFKNYRLGVWVKTENGAVASAAVTGYDYKGPNTDPGVDYGKPQLRVESELTEGDAENTARYGWKEIAFYIKGSSFADYKIGLELWLGKQSETAAGVAMFDNIRIEEITSKEFTDYSGSGTSVKFDAETTSGSITNGGFDSIEEYDEYVEPFKPSGWTLLAAGEDGTAGMSTQVADKNYRDYFVSGVIASNASKYTYRKPDGNKFEGSIVTYKNDFTVGSVPSNLLMMKSDETTGVPDERLGKGGVAVGYKSSSFSISSNTVQRVDVNLCADAIGGYGANLVLKNGSNVIATIEKIKDTGHKYETFTFYVNTGDTDLSEVYVEIWLGLYDDKTNESKLATGTLLVEDVKLTNMVASSDDENSDNTAAVETARSEFYAKVTEYQTKYDAGTELNTAVYSSQKEDFTAFDRYSDSFLKNPYNWTTESIQANKGDSAAVYGIFDSRDIVKTSDSSGDNGSGVYVPDGYKHANADNRHSLLIKNTSPAASRIKSTTSYTLASGSYYTITVKAKVDIPIGQKAERPDYKGAYIGIADTDHYIEDIKSTADVKNVYNNDDDSEDAYKVFTFYVRTAGEAATEDDDSSSSSNTADTIVTLEFGIGGSGSRDQWAIGTLMVNSIEVTQVSNLDYEDMQTKLEKAGALQKKYNAIANYASDDEEEEEDDNTNTDNITGDNWYVYMTVILAVVIIIALIAVLVRYYGIKRKREASGDPSAPSYDREKTLVRQHNKRAQEEEAIADTLDTYEMFDEDEEDKLEAEELAKLEKEELLKLGAAEETESEPPVAEDAEDQAETESGATEEPQAEPMTEEKAEDASGDDAAEDEEDDTYTYSDDIVDFTPSEAKKKELEAKKAEAERIKAEQEAAKKKAEEERAKAEAERKAAERRYNNWDSFDD